MPARDNLLTLIAISLLAYASADIAHHAFGHGGACLALGGRIISLSSVFVDCTIHGAAIDLAGPFANLLLGAIALSVFSLRQSAGNPTARLFWGLAAAFNLFWFLLQLSFSAASRTDDWAWALQQFHVGAPARIAIIAAGLVGYGAAAMIIARGFAGYAFPGQRLKRIVRVAWLTAGLFACATALLDHAPIAAILNHAAPQSFGLSVGLLLLPRLVADVEELQDVVRLSRAWLAIAGLVAGLSIVLLGPGFAL